MSLNPFSLGGPLRVHAPQAATHAAPQAAEEKPQPPAKGDDYLVRLAKLAPPEVISVYLAVKGFFVLPKAGTDGYEAKLAEHAHDMLLLGIIATLAAAFWRWSTTHEAGKPPQITSIVFATISFVLWVYATGGTVWGIDFLMSKAHAPWPAAFAAFWTFLAPQLQKGD